MSDLVARLRRGAEDKGLAIGEAWNLLDEAADALSVAVATLERIAALTVPSFDTAFWAAKAAREALEEIALDQPEQP